MSLNIPNDICLQHSENFTIRSKQSLQYARKEKKQKNGIEKNESIKRIIV